MEKQTREFKTVSFVCLSPRESKAFYKKVDFEEIKKEWIKEEEEKEKKEMQGKINIIYPFYSYGEYDELYSDDLEYYIPGSSIKGAILNKEIKEKQFRVMVDDACIKKDSITLKRLKKFQYLIDRKEHKNKDEAREKGKYGVFFDNVGIQMLRPGESFKTELYFQGQESIEEVLNKVGQNTNMKLQNMVSYIDEILKEKIDDSDSVWERLKEEKESIDILLKSGKQLLFLGGYKGLIASISKEIEKKNMEQIKDTALFAEKIHWKNGRNLLLPYGLVEIIRK